MSQNSTPGWLLDEAANAGRENLDADHVSRYDTKEDAAAADEIAVLRGAGLNDESEVVEMVRERGSSPSPSHRRARAWSPSTCRR